jgi:hypothetical protein
MKPTLRIITVAAVAALSMRAAGRADAVLDWNAIMMTTISGQESVRSGARFAAITEAAVFEAVNAISGVPEPYLGTITAPPGASAEAAAAAAAHGVLRNYFAGSALTLDAALVNSLAAIPDGQAEDDEVAVGEAAAAAMIAARAAGSSAPRSSTCRPGQPGEWQTDAPAVRWGILLQWRNMTPFAIESSDQFLRTRRRR